MKNLILLSIVSIFMALSCSIDRMEASIENIGIDGYNSLIDMTIELPDTICPAGGMKINSGIDINKNDTLDLEEISSTAYICNGKSGGGGSGGSNGLSPILEFEAFEANCDCFTGGIIIHTGYDLDKNKKLDETEIISSSAFCLSGNNQSGPVELLIVFRVETVDAGNLCTNGGFRIHAGFDHNSNEVLDDLEIDNSEVICIP